ncbi:Cupin domain-containing protein [Paenibacillus sp. UNCCL117]|uniref:cupin domain-containing protein n=1 Tax=unclassified Paenibacillus TaxID=185978 RepID=UPI00088C9F4D|nr:MULTISPECIES: cupin domain-containing protein [unclassified Paenibacillus]SDD32143.1 Cupin domain-containing protein [Paenibacillus sp. cl123]SFW39922.1 Cupin domain-containing protein [Paenibacillus sp. UNCCL117]
MIIRNYLQAELGAGSSHRGKGLVHGVRLFDNNDYDSPLRFMYYTEIPPGASIGYHKHGQDEEVYVILEGRGLMTVNGETREVGAGDVILNKPGWSHGLENAFDETMRLLIYEAALCPAAVSPGAADAASATATTE